MMDREESKGSNNRSFFQKNVESIVEKEKSKGSKQDFLQKNVESVVGRVEANTENVEICRYYKIMHQHQEEVTSEVYGDLDR